MTMAMALVWTDLLGMGLSLAFIALVLWLMFRRRWLVSVIVVGMMVALVIAASVWRSGLHFRGSRSVHTTSPPISNNTIGGTRATPRVSIRCLRTIAP